MTKAMPDWRWQDDAACLGADPDAWYPDESNRVEVQVALRICGGCGVRAECLNDALERQETIGIWGGLTEDERRPLLRNAQPRRRPSSAAVRDQAPARVVAEGSQIAGWKRAGLSDEQVARQLRCSPKSVRLARRELGIGVAGRTSQREAVAA